MRNQHQFFCLLTLATILIIFLSGCKDEEESGFASLLPFDATQHIYGNMDFNYIDQWEIVIDINTGKIDTIPGTRTQGGWVTLPIGTRSLTAFNNNQRVFLDEADRTNLIIQDLETFATISVELKDFNTDQSVINPQIFEFGANENELFLLDTDKSIWSVDVDNNRVEKILEIGPTFSGKYISDFFYISATGDFLVTTNEIAINASTTTDLYLLDRDTGTIISTASITEGFGFQQLSTEDQTFYFLQTPTDDTGFRLMEVELGLNDINVTAISDKDLEIDQLSPYLQTIHSATNSYICRGGASSIEAPMNTLYSIDLSSGQLISQVELKQTGLLLKLAGN